MTASEEMATPAPAPYARDNLERRIQPTQVHQ